MFTGIVLYMGVGEWSAFSLSFLLLLFPVLLLAVNCTVVLVVVGAKWLILGAVRRGIHPLWSFFMWRFELITEMDRTVGETLAPWMSGTPLFNVYYRLSGASIGRRCCLIEALVEPDLTRLGDHCIVEGVLQTHLFEDRLLKLGPVSLADGCHVGYMGVVLYDSTLYSGAHLAASSLCMKNEALSAGVAYHGVPAEAVPRQNQFIFV
jgi:non-ribosomal peptide synthetase-like protein